MKNIKKYHEIVVESISEFDKMLAHSGRLKSLIQPKLNELSKCSETVDVLIKIILVGDPEEEFCRHLFKILFDRPLPTDFSVNFNESGRYWSTFKIGDRTLQVNWVTIKAAAFSYSGYFEGQLGIVAFSPKTVITVENIELLKEIFKTQAQVQFLGNTPKPPFDLNIPDGIQWDWRDIQGADTAIQFLLHQVSLEQAHVHSALLTVEALYQEMTALARKIEQLNIANLKLMANPVPLSRTDPSMAVKGILRDEISNAERILKTDIEMYFSADGSYANEVETTSKTLEKLEIIKKNKKDIYSIDKTTYIKYQKIISEELMEKHENLEHVVKNVMTRLLATVNLSCQQKLLCNVDLHVNNLDLDRDFPLTMEANYQNSSLGGGFFKLLTASRGFAMTFTVWFGIVGSVFGFALRSYEYYPHILACVLITGLVISLIMQKRESKELSKETLDGAQSYLTDQALKIGQATSAKWRTQLGEHLRVVEKQITEQVDEMVRFQNKEKEKSDKKNKQLESRIIESNNEIKSFFANSQNSIRDNPLEKKLKETKVLLIKDSK